MKYLTTTSKLHLLLCNPVGVSKNHANKTDPLNTYVIASRDNL